jgi:hypothetical protein
MNHKQNSEHLDGDSMAVVGLVLSALSGFIVGVVIGVCL